MAYPETSVNYNHALCNSPEERITQKGEDLILKLCKQNSVNLSCSLFQLSRTLKPVYPNSNSRSYITGKKKSQFKKSSLLKRTLGNADSPPGYIRPHVHLSTDHFSLIYTLVIIFLSNIQHRQLF